MEDYLIIGLSLVIIVYCIGMIRYTATHRRTLGRRIDTIMKGEKRVA